MMKGTIEDLLNYLCHVERAIKNHTFLQAMFFFNISTHTVVAQTHTHQVVCKKSCLVYKHAPKPLYITINSKLGGHAT